MVDSERVARMTRSSTWRRLVEGVVLAPLTLLISCAGNVTDAPTSPTSQPSLAPSAQRETTSAAPPECMGTVSTEGRFRMSGGPLRTVLTDEAFSFSCGTGQLVSLTEIADTAVTFTADAPVTITSGSSAAVGPYRITVLSIDAGTAMFKVVAPS